MYYVKGVFTKNSTKSRKFQLTFNNPQEHGYSHEAIKNILSSFKNITYWCMCDEKGQTYHTHLYLYSPNAILFDTVHQRFYGAHIEAAKGSHQENRDYIRKKGKWKDSEKQETNLPETFEESGDMPVERTNRQKDSEVIFDMIVGGATNAEIVREVPSAMMKIQHMDATRQTLLAEEYRTKWRDLHVAYIWGKTGVGKTRSIMEKYGYDQVYRINSYAHPFDNYKGEPVILFDEFRSSLPISDMLKYLEGYPVWLPCRYNDKVACFTSVYIVSNIPLTSQYPNVQIDEPETWSAFCRRFHENYELLPRDAACPFE